MANKCESTTAMPEETIPITTIAKKANRFMIMNWLVNESGIEGMTKERAAGFCGNMFAESGYNTNSVNPTSKAYGLCQWLGARKINLKNFAAKLGKSFSDIEVQLNFLKTEITGAYYKKNCWNKVLNAPNTIEDATRIILRYYEVPGRDAAEADAQTEKIAPIRIGYAKKAFDCYPNNKDGSL